MTLKGAEGMSDLDEDMQIAVRAPRFLSPVAALGVLGVPRQRGAWERSFVLVADVALLFYYYFVSATSTSTSRFELFGRFGLLFAAVFTRLFPRASYLTAATPETNAPMPVNDMTGSFGRPCHDARSGLLRTPFLSNQLLVEFQRTVTRRTTSVHIAAPAGRRACARSRPAAAGQGDHRDRAVHRAARGAIQGSIRACD